MDKYGIYKKITIPMEESQISLIKIYETKALAITDLKNHKGDKYTKYYIASVEE